MRTEERNPISTDLDQMPVADILKIMSREDVTALRAVRRASDAMVRATEAVAACYLRGGTCIYAGAGTSGRIAAMEVAELKPTFGVATNSFVAMIAGGAFMRSVEGAEDDRAGARLDLLSIVGGSAGRGTRNLHMPPGAEAPLVLGISASGTTPYVMEAIACARENEFQTIGMANNPGAPLLDAVDIPIFLDTGPEVIAGSTRLKAGTAQKMALNMISVGAMALCGRVHSNFMSHMTPVSDKLKQRAVRIIMSRFGLDESAARRRLESANWSMPAAMGN